MTEATPISKDPIEIGRGRRPMECLLTAEEKQRDSDQVHSELEIRAQKEAERDTLDAQAKAKKEASKAVDEEITELDLKIKELSTAVRTGRATRPVEVVKLYDPVKGEIMERREDTKQLMPLGRAPTAQEWDSIKAKMQPPIEVTNDPCRAPREIPGLDPELLDEIADEMEEGQALTIQVLGYRMALREGDAFTVDERRIDLMLEAAALDGVTEGAPELSKAERWAFTAGVRQGVAELAKVDDDGTPFAAPEPRPLDPDRFEELKAQARQMGAAHRTGAPEGWHGLPSLLDALGGPAVFDDTPAAQRDAIAAAYEVGRSAPTAGPGATTVSQDEAPSLRAPSDVPGINLDELRDVDMPPTLRELGRRMAVDVYLPSDRPDRQTEMLLDNLKDDDSFNLTEAELAEFSAGVAAGIEEQRARDAEERKAREPGPLTEQVRQNVDRVAAQAEAAPKKRTRAKKGAAS